MLTLTCADLARAHRAAVRLMRQRGVPQHVGVDDLTGAAGVGLVHAAQRYDSARGVPWPAFAEQYMRWAMMDYLREQDPLARSMRRHVNGKRRYQCQTADARACDPADAAAGAELWRRVGALLHGLPGRQQHIVRGLYFDGLTVTQLAQRLAVTSSAVCQMHRRALERLRRHLAAYRVA